MYAIISNITINMFNHLLLHNCKHRNKVYKLDPETARDIIGTQGYLLLYNKPDMPPPLKGRKRKRTLGDTPKRRWIPRVARRFFSMRESSSNFRACGDQPSGIVTVPHIPVRSSQPERRRAHYPSALELTNRLPVNSQNTQSWIKMSS